MTVRLFKIDSLTVFNRSYYCRPFTITRAYMVTLEFVTIKYFNNYILARFYFNRIDNDFDKKIYNYITSLSGHE